MGQMRFLLPRREQTPENVAELAYLGGSDEIPWPCETLLEGDLLTISRDDSEAACLYSPWIDETRGPLMLATTNLPERSKPFLLPLELARGTLNRVRNQVGNWQQAGLKLPAEWPAQLRRATEPLIQAILAQQDPGTAADWSAESIQASLELAEFACREYARQVTAIRHEQNAPPSSLLGLRISQRPTPEQTARIAEAFNSVWVSVDWAQLQPTMDVRQWGPLDKLIDWTRERSLKVCLGPILQFDRRCLPDWLFLWEDEYESVVNYALEHVSQTVRRYKGKVNLWQVTAGSNLPGAIGLEEDQRLKLTVEVVERVRQIDPKTPILVGFDRPFNEYIATHDQELTPLHHADMLVRGNVGVAGVTLELNLGCSPSGSWPRDPLAISRLVDRWSQLGAPLVLQLSLPMEGAPTPGGVAGSGAIAGGAAERQLRRWAPQYWDVLFRTLIAKQAVQAVVWNQTSDAEGRCFPAAGVFQSSSEPKPVLAQIEALRRELLP